MDADAVVYPRTCFKFFYFFLEFFLFLRFFRFCWCFSFFKQIFRYFFNNGGPFLERTAHTQNNGGPSTVSPLRTCRICRIRLRRRPPEENNGLWQSSTCGWRGRSRCESSRRLRLVKGSAASRRRATSFSAEMELFSVNGCRNILIVEFNMIGNLMDHIKSLFGVSYIIGFLIRNGMWYMVLLRKCVHCWEVYW